jgi:hypothetical protein
MIPIFRPRVCGVFFSLVVVAHVETHVIHLQSDKRGAINRRRKYNYNPFQWMRMTTLAVKIRQHTAH